MGWACYILGSKDNTSVKALSWGRVTSAEKGSELLVNNFMQISLERDNPNKSSALFYWLLMKYHWTHAVCLTHFSRNQLLCPKTLATFPLSGDFQSDMLGNREIDQVSPMFISDHANTWDVKQILQILFFKIITQISFFVIPKVCLSKCVFHCLNTCWRRFMLWVWVHFPKPRLVIEPQAKTVRKKVQRKSKAFFFC